MNKTIKCLIVVSVYIALIFLYLSISEFEWNTNSNYTFVNSDITIKVNETTTKRTVINKIYKVETLFNFRTLKMVERETISLDNSFYEITEYLKSKTSSITSNTTYMNKRYIVLPSGKVKLIYDYEELKKEYLNRIVIIGSLENDKSKIKSILLRTDIDILKYLKEINIHDTDYVPCGNNIMSIYPSPIGCSVNYYPPEEKSSIIDVVSSNFWISTNNWIMCSSFEYTVNHEIGHIDGARYYDKTEEYADRYAEQHTLDKGRC